MDNRTKVVLFKLLRGKVLGEISGCISTGKEGNVYIGARGEKAPADWPAEFAVKIQKTCILKFKDRERYVAGELRFQSKAGTRNSRKSVILWAEKEFRNLSRLHNNKVPSPRPLLVKANILFMELITQCDVPAPLLREVPLQPDDYERLYKQVVIDMRHIYQQYQLVHADLSEYNLLVRDGQAIFIDVGQAVEQDNVNATVFLRNDIAVITKFFRSAGVKTAPLMRLFEFVVERQLLTDVHWVLKEIRDMDDDMGVDEFLGLFIPRRLDQVTDPELEVMDLADGIFDQAALHGALTGVIPSGLALPDGVPYEVMSPEEEDDEDEEEVSEEEEDGTEKKVTLDRRDFTKDEWKEKLREIKSANRERRKTKKPKVEKGKQYRKGHPNAK
jgi:RIO kinase 1